MDHLGLSRLYGMVGQMSGELRLDPARPEAATVQIDIPLSGLTVTSSQFAGRLATSKAETVGFSATAKLKRSEFGLGYAVPAVSDEVSLEITAAFEKAPG